MPKWNMGTKITNINVIATILESDYQFGVNTQYTSIAKIDDMTIETTNGDVLTLNVAFQLGDY